MSKLNHQSCPLCGSAHIHRAMDCTDYYATREKFDVYHCDDCHFIFTQDAPVESEIGKYYESPNYISHSDTRKGAMNTIYHWVRCLMLRRKARLVENESQLKTGCLLDIGTGTGYFPHVMQQRGWKVSAIEKSAQAREFGQTHFGLDVKAESELAHLPNGEYDAITLWHVMEHLEHLDETWKELSRLLKSKGVVVIAVPNCGSYDARIYGNQWAAYDVPRHLWHFTPQSMQALGKKHGFELTAYYPMPFDAYYVSMLSEKDMGHSCSLIKGMWNGLKAQCHAMGHKELSSSIIYIFRKQ